MLSDSQYEFLCQSMDVKCPKCSYPGDFDLPEEFEYERGTAVGVLRVEAGCTCHECGQRWVMHFRYSSPFQFLGMRIIDEE